MSRDASYSRWTLEEAALDAALSNAARQALHGINRGAAGYLEEIARTSPRQFVAIGTLDQIAALVAEALRTRDAG